MVVRHIFVSAKAVRYLAGCWRLGADVAVRILRRIGIIRCGILGSETVPDQCHLFFGDLPKVPRTPIIGHVVRKSADPVNRWPAELFVCDFRYKTPRPELTHENNIRYLPPGTACRGFQMIQDYSVRSIGLKSLLWQFRRTGRILDQATIIHAEYPNTYGDWVTEHLKALALVGNTNGPLVLPAFFRSRQYVNRDLAFIGQETVFADEPILIRNCTVIHKTKTVNGWDAADVAAFRKKFRFRNLKPIPGSILYLSRAGVVSAHAGVTREIRHECVEKVIQAFGGQTVKTDGLGIEDFLQLGERAEIIVADHGAAMFNILHWNAKHVIEIVPDDWWSRCFVILSNACGVESHFTISDTQDSDIEAKLTQILIALTSPGGRTVREQYFGSRSVPLIGAEPATAYS